MEVRLSRNNVRVILDDECNEGIYGDYHEDDSHDLPLLRFSIEIFENGGWERL